MSIFADDFLDMMPSTLTVKPFLSRSDEGVATYGVEASYRCRIDNRVRNVIGPNGQQVVANGKAYIATVQPISANDMVTFPDGIVPVILLVNKAEDETGNGSHTVVYFQ